MHDNIDPADNAGTAPAPVPPRKHRRRKPLWWRITRVFLWIIAALIILVVATLGVGVWVLTPQKLTPMVERVASQYLNADVTAARIELKYWSTFPRLQLTVDSLRVVSKSLDALPSETRALLPADADSLLFVKRLYGEVDLPALVAMKVKLRDVSIADMRANVVALNDSVTNYDILPPSEAADTAAAGMPDLTLNHFRLDDGLRVRYFNAADTTDVTLHLRPTTLDAAQAPLYTLSTGGLVEVRIGEIALPPEVTFAFDGSLTWRSDTPRCLELDGCDIAAGPVSARVSTAMDFSDGLTLNTLDARLAPLDVTALLQWLPQTYTEPVKGIKTNMTLTAAARLLSPWDVTRDPLPSAEISLEVPACSLEYQQMTLSKLEVDAIACYDAANPHASVITLRNLTAVGEGVGFNFKGSATDLLRDPLIKGSFRGGVGFARIPQALMQMLPFTLQGVLRAKADLTLRPSYLDRLNFHRVKVEGTASLNNFRLLYPDSGGSVYARHADLKFGTSSSFKARDGHRVDSLLTASLTVDTVAYDLEGMVINAGNLKLGGGISNKSASADTATVVPLGIYATADRIRYLDTADSSQIMMRSPVVFGSVKRYKESARLPLLHAIVKSKFMRWVSPAGRVSLVNPSVDLSLHPNARPRMSASLSLIYDSIQAANPGLRPDSILAMARSERRAARRARRQSRGEGATERRPRSREDSIDVIDLRATGETRSLLQWWDASGRIQATRGRFMSPYFPLRNSLRDVDIEFDMDSLVVHGCTIRSGRSDLMVEGVVSNYTGAMLRRREAVNIDLRLRGDTLDINQLADAAFIGAAYAAKTEADSVHVVSAGEDTTDDQLQKQVEAASDSTAGPLLVPMNIDASLSLNSKVALYGGLTLRDLHGAANIHGGALQLRELAATTDAGTVSLNALYTAPTAANMEFGIGLELKNFYIERFTKLFPPLDTIMPMLNAISGRINAEMAATTDIEPNMDINLPSLSALLTIRGDSLVVIDPETYKTIAKWLRFKEKDHNMIDSISTQIAIENSSLEIYPFIFNFDRYKLGVMGHNDLAMNLNYHVSVLKSPIPFKFGINIKGTPDDMKIRLGGAKVKENMVAERVTLVSDTRVNLIREMDNVFARGVRNARIRKLRAAGAAGTTAMSLDDHGDLTPADSAILIKEGLLPPPPQQPPLKPSSKK